MIIFTNIKSLSDGRILQYFSVLNVSVDLQNQTFTIGIGGWQTLSDVLIAPPELNFNLEIHYATHEDYITLNNMKYEDLVFTLPDWNNSVIVVDPSIPKPVESIYD